MNCLKWINIKWFDIVDNELEWWQLIEIQCKRIFINKLFLIKWWKIEWNWWKLRAFILYFWANLKTIENIVWKFWDTKIVSILI